MKINFYTLEKNTLNTSWMLLAKFSNMPQTAYKGTKAELKKLIIALNSTLNKVYKKENYPILKPFK